jgi:hypothetical protein
MRDQDLAAQIKNMPDDELRATRRDLATGIGLMRLESPMHGPATAYLSALDTELAQRQGASARTTTAPRRCTT